MALADLDYRGLAAAINQEGMGEHTLRNWANPKVDKRPQAHHLRYIAEACGLSPAFFAIDFATVASPADSHEERLRQLEARLAVIEAEGHAQSDDTSLASEDPPR